MVQILDTSDDNIRLAAKQLAEGGLVAMPTETVYGLAADATNDHAVARIFEAKGRPSFNPVIVHVNDLTAAQDIVDIDDRAENLASVFWPGPLTMILPRKADAAISLLTSAGLPTQAIRIPVHPIARKLITALGRPIAAPSANASGSLSPTTPQHVAQSLGEKAGIILAGGKAGVGLESTVIDMTGTKPVLLRPGGVTAEELRMILGDIDIELLPVNDKPKSPGQLLRHYAPKTSLRLNAVDVAPDEALLGFGSLRFMGIKDGGFAKDLPAGQLLNLSESGDLTEAAGNLFSMLHQLDQLSVASIAVMNIPDTGLGMAINDRLKKAAGAQKA